MTKDIQFQVECLTTELAELPMEEYGWNVKRALDELYASETFAKLNDPLCGLYYESAPYVFTFLKSEIETGRLG